MTAGYTAAPPGSRQGRTTATRRCDKAIARRPHESRHCSSSSGSRGTPLFPLVLIAPRLAVMAGDTPLPSISPVFARRWLDKSFKTWQRTAARKVQAPQARAKRYGKQKMVKITSEGSSRILMHPHMITLHPKLAVVQLQYLMSDIIRCARQVKSYLSGERW